jgi:hypothetical protein
MEPIELTLPLPPALTNSNRGRSRHWRALHKERDAYWERLDWLVTLRQIPSAPATPLERAEAEGVLYLWNPMDDGNAMARLKWLEDWLVRRGYLQNDSRKHLRWRGLPDQVIDRKNPGRLVLVLRPNPSSFASPGRKARASG